MMSYAFMVNVYHGMSRGTNESVVKSEAEAFLFGQMRVYDVAVELVCISERREKSGCLSGEIVLCAYVYKSLSAKLVHFLVIAEQGTFFGILRLYQKRADRLLLALNKHQRY